MGLLQNKVHRFVDVGLLLSVGIVPLTSALFGGTIRADSPVRRPAAPRGEPLVTELGSELK